MSHFGLIKGMSIFLSINHLFQLTVRILLTIAFLIQACLII